MSSRPIIISEDYITDSAVRRLIFDAGADIDDLITLCEADITTKNQIRFKNTIIILKLLEKRSFQLKKKISLEISSLLLMEKK